MYDKERERGIEKEGSDRQTDRQGEGQRLRYTQREADRQTERQREGKRERHGERQVCGGGGGTETERHRETDRERETQRECFKQIILIRKQYK